MVTALRILVLRILKVRPPRLQSLSSTRADFNPGGVGPSDGHESSSGGQRLDRLAGGKHQEVSILYESHSPILVGPWVSWTWGPLYSRARHHPRVRVAAKEPE